MITLGQKWTHKLTSLQFSVALVDGEDILLEPQGAGQEITLEKNLLLQEFKCPDFRKPQSKKEERRIKPGKIRRGVRR